MDCPVSDLEEATSSTINGIIVDVEIEHIVSLCAVIMKDSTSARLAVSSIPSPQSKHRACESEA
jgi:hypothetical protein